MNEMGTSKINVAVVLVFSNFTLDIQSAIKYHKQIQFRTRTREPTMMKPNNW